MDYSIYGKNDKYYAGSEEKIGITIDNADYIIKFQKRSKMTVKHISTLI
jgi:hypothetical protein